ncbi:MAG: long-chain-fatty-acid--CoA ligase [Solirubrobacterales bacterium]|nr:long-chain-fatty-acid--CoA ligase [Solirubrobacterales bacterium]
MTLGEVARRNARLYPDKPAFVCGERSVTFAEHNARVNRLIHALHAHGLQAGDRIAVLSRNSLEYFDVYGAGEKGGFPIAPLNFRLTVGELAGIVENIEPRALFAQSPYLETGRDLAKALGDDLLLIACDGGAPSGCASLDEMLSARSDAEPDTAIDPDDVCYLMSTSGTTGRPRAAMLDHRGQWLDALTLALEMRLAPTDRHLATMPLFHVGGRAIVLAHTLRGCTVHLHDEFDAGAVVRDIATHQVTTTQVVPAMLAWLLDEPLDAWDLSSLRLVWYASAPMPLELLRRAISRFGPIFVQGYGQTESGPLATALSPEEHVLEGEEAGRLSSCGRAVPGVDVRIVDERGIELPRGEVGEIAICSPFNMVGYWREPELTGDAVIDGWLRTGDMGRMDELGYVYIVDRKKDMIISGGENVFPRECEEVLYSHAAVLEAAVIGVPHPVWGETPRAIVVRRPDGRISERELIAFCRDRLAHYKCPTAVEFRSELPRTPSGKVLKRELREPYWQAVARREPVR